MQNCNGKYEQGILFWILNLCCFEINENWMVLWKVCSISCNPFTLGFYSEFKFFEGTAYVVLNGDITKNFKSETFILCVWFRKNKGFYFNFKNPKE